MDAPLAGMSVLIVEDEPLVALDVARSLEAAGAIVLKARTVADALSLAETPGLSAAVVDHGLRGEDSSDVCKKLTELRIPFVIYSGYSNIDGACAEGMLLQKPIHPAMLVATVSGLLGGSPAAH